MYNKLMEMKNKKGFTLVEVLITIALTSLVLVSVGSSIFFISQITSKTMKNSALNYQLLTVRDFIIKNELEDNTNFNFKDNDLYYVDTLLASDTSIKSIDFYLKDQFVYSNINYLKENLNLVLTFAVKIID